MASRASTALPRAAGLCLAPCRRPVPLAPARSAALARRRSRGAPLTCRAHAGHGHQHSHSHGASCDHDHSCDHDQDHEHEHGHDHSHNHSRSDSHSHSESNSHSHGGGGGCGGGCGHDHSHGPDLSNPMHRLLARLYDSTRLTPAAAWLESSEPASIGKVALFLTAAAAARYAGWAPAAGGAAAARVLAGVATAGVYALAGPPAAVSLTYDLTAGKVDTHMLMHLAVLGTLATGHVLEGALLLVLFQSSHVVEHKLTEKAQGSLAALYKSMPKAAVLVRLGPGGAPDLCSARRVAAAAVAVGDCMLVKPGEQIPLDGTIVHGRAMVSAEHITGESLPVLSRAGDEVAAGSLNRDGLLVVQALRPAAESTPARIAQLTLDAQTKRPQLRTLLDRFGESYSRGVIAAALLLLALLVWQGVPLLGAAGQRGAFYRAMGFLTVASPCALVMVPLAYVSAIAACASRGILVKGGRVLDALAGCSIVAFDKTGTLTTGSLSCTSMRPLGATPAGTSTAGSSFDASSSSSSRRAGSAASVLGVPPREAAAAKRSALAAAVALSLRSSHPVSDAVVLHGAAAGLDGSGEEVADFQLVAGGGVEGVVSAAGGGKRGGADGGAQHAALGSLEYVSGRLSREEVAAVEAAAAAQGTSSVLSVLVLTPTGEATSGGDAGSSGGGGSGRSVWVMAFEDSVRQQSASAVRALQTGSWTGAASHANRMSVQMLTGDNEASAQRIARKLGIAHVAAALSPEQKLARVQQLSGREGCHSDSGVSAGGGGAGSSGARRRQRAPPAVRGGRPGGVMMVGDGINDAPALAAADVGVAIASNATAAASLAADVVIVSGSGIGALPQLLRVAHATRAVVAQNLALAAGSVLALALPTLLGWVPLWFAVMLHEGSTLAVALNSLRLLAYGAPPRRGGAATAATAAAQQQPVVEEAAPAPASGGSCSGHGHGHSHSHGEQQGNPAVAPMPAAVPPAA